MKLRNIAISLVFTVILNFTNAQPAVQYHLPAELNYKEARTGGGIACYNSKAETLFSIGVTPLDSNTTVYYPLNELTHYTNLSYFTNCALVQVNFSVHSSIPVDNMLYSVAGDEDPIPQWKKLNGRFVKQNEPNGDYRTNIFLDPLACRNKVLTIKLYNTTNPEIVLKQIVSTVPIEQPVLFGNLTGYQVMDSVKLKGMPVARQERKNLANASLTASAIQDIESANLFLNTNNSPYVYSVSLIRHRKTFTDTLPIYFSWGTLDAKTIKANNFFDLKKKGLYRNNYWASLPIEYMRTPGTYEISVAPAFIKFSRYKGLYNGKTASIKFEVRPSRVVDEFYVILYSILFLLLALLVFIWYKRKQKRKMQQQQQLTKEAKLKLEAVRSQLNPHFIFNALAGIQNLVNKNETGKALNYLSSFARITRSVLGNSTKELITVDEEIKWLTDYLDMEQLRFGFQYVISTDRELDKHNTEIPAMLLQPLVENAIKHGVSSLKEAGHVAINFHKAGNDIYMSIADNGKGYDTSKEYSGAGLPLSKSRIALLNTIYKNNPVELKIESGANGTKSIITLKNWL
jgi:anti-sigma regulatory factor (Ser/Thr protein kinase)